MEPRHQGRDRVRLWFAEYRCHTRNWHPAPTVPVTLGLLAVASTITVVQRILLVRSQAKAAV